MSQRSLGSSTSGGGGGDAPVGQSQIPACPSFRSLAVNAVAVLPLLSSDNNGHDDPTTHSSKSFEELMEALRRFGGSEDRDEEDSVILVVPNSNLTRPGDWKYDQTPLKNFHWAHGCQRLAAFDGRPYHSRMAHDRIMNHGVTREWIDLCPHRRTAALIGVLNIRDCPDMATLQKAEHEWRNWAERYSTPPYEVTAHGRDLERDAVVRRLFIFDSFREDSGAIDLAQLRQELGSSLVAFPPADDGNTHMMDLHMNVVINDLAVAVFQELESRIRGSDSLTGTKGQPLTPAASKSRFFQKSSSTASSEGEDGEGPKSSSNLSLGSIASVVSPENKLASSTPAQKSKRSPSASSLFQFSGPRTPTKGASTEAQLITPLDDVWDYSELSPKDAQGMLRREVGRREKFAADLSLLAGSPMDAYERYTKAAELCKTSDTPDPLWYAKALEGCAAAHIAMAEAGGFQVDEYLEQSIQLSDDIMACAVMTSNEKSSHKQSMTRVVTALCDEALNILSRHPRLAAFRAELLLKLSWYCAEVEDMHARCQWGMGYGCYSGIDENSGKSSGAPNMPRWQKSSMTRLNFLELKNKEGEDVITINTLRRCQHWVGFMHQAISVGELDPVSRSDVALRCAVMSLRGLRPTQRPTSQERSDVRIQFHRKASFFAVAAAEAMSEVSSGIAGSRTGSLWMYASRLLSSKGNENASTRNSYGWAAMRAPVLHALVMQGIPDISEDAAIELLALMGKMLSSDQEPLSSGGKATNNSLAMISEDRQKVNNSLQNSRITELTTEEDIAFSGKGAESVVSAARSRLELVRTRAQDARSRGSLFFGTANAPSSLLTVAQSKWVEDDPISTIQLPLSDASDISNILVAPRCNWSDVRLEHCITAQRRVLTQISGLRNDLPASTMLPSAESGLTFPIRISSVEIVEPEVQTKLERIKKKPKAKTDSEDAMATFYNPYANKKNAAQPVLIAEGDERFITVKFASNMSVPLEVPRCHLEFDEISRDRVKAPAVSFIVPGKAKDFSVQFPFLVLPTGLSQEGENKDNSPLGVFSEVKGLHLSCMGRTSFIPITPGGVSNEQNVLPDSASLYSRREYHTKMEEQAIKVPRFEIMPSQPNLIASLISSLAPADEVTVIPIPICDGEIYDIPPIRLRNESGPNSFGQIKEMKASICGLPGKPTVPLFHLTEGSDGDGSYTETIETHVLNVTVSCHGIHVDTLNSPDGANSIICLQIEAAHNMGAYEDDCAVSLRFDYRGASPAADIEIWRKREVQIRIIRIKGPRISSLTFRPDLSWQSAYLELSKSLAKRSTQKTLANEESEMEPSDVEAGEAFVLGRVGLDPGVHVCGEKIVVLLSVANETKSTIILSKADGFIGGFENDTIETMRISSGVSAKIPILLPRMPRVADVLGEVISSTTLQWKSEIDGKEAGAVLEKQVGRNGIVPMNRRVRSGSIKIPSTCLQKIIHSNPVFLSRVCVAPCVITVRVNEEDHKILPGRPVSVEVQVSILDWVPADVLENCTFFVDFCCARLGQDSNDLKSCCYAWSGQIRKRLQFDDATTKQKSRRHGARIMFVHPGDYVVSACLAIQRNGKVGRREVWWAEKAERIQVMETDSPRQ